MGGSDPRSRAETLVRTTLSLSDGALRAGYVASVVRTWPLAQLAIALDAICQGAEQAERAEREALLAVVDALNGEGMGDIVQRLREQASGESLLSLERFLRHPARALRGETSRPPPPPRTLDGERGRTLTLGERKSLARRPDRDTMQRLLADPHPDVIRRCLENPRVTEDDIVPLAAKRPGRSDVLTEIARSRWVHRPRVRLALALNPATPAEITARIAGLLRRPELMLVARSPHVPAGVRALCLEHLGRRPPVVGPRRTPPQVH